MCRALHVSRSGYYGWQETACRPRVRANAALDAEIGEVFKSHRGRYGSPRVTRVLQGRAIACSEDWLARRMRALGLAARAKKAFVPRTTDSRYRGLVCPNLLLHRTQPRRAHQVWLSDITYVATRQGWLYLAGFLDLATRRLVGWATGPTLEAAWVCQGLCNAQPGRCSAKSAPCPV